MRHLEPSDPWSRSVDGPGGGRSDPQGAARPKSKQLGLRCVRPTQEALRTLGQAGPRTPLPPRLARAGQPRAGQTRHGCSRKGHRAHSHTGTPCCLLCPRRGLGGAPGRAAPPTPWPFGVQVSARVGARSPGTSVGQPRAGLGLGVGPAGPSRPVLWLLPF